MSYASMHPSWLHLHLAWVHFLYALNCIKIATVIDLADNALRQDTEHYKKIIAALKLTEELMAEIDQVVEF